MEFALREYEAADAAAVLRLNAESVAVLSPMDADRLRLLAAMCRFHLVALGPVGVIGFVMGFTDGAAYDSANYRWFAARYRCFLYLDRMVVAASFRGCGVGRAFHAAAERHAIASGLDWLVGEIDLDPPNPVSLAYHERLGFVEVGRQTLPSGKVVSMRARRVSQPRS
ncbi:MAG: GNAT family N-acetyltransferase [Candidatus Bipolaricaulota bacterium]|nr:GNAT family N-acetyltransferase [Candidatus Bipolaricaulota bacterium]